jgi:hypothetical protein
MTLGGLQNGGKVIADERAYASGGATRRRSAQTSSAHPDFATRMQLAFGRRVLGLCSLTSSSLVTATGAFPANRTTASAKVANKTGSTRKYVPGSGARSTA